MTLPKPKPCNQIWEEMTPQLYGRKCALCSKVVVDFSEMKWPEVRAIQADGDYSICGFYSKKQLESWNGVSNKGNQSGIFKLAAVLLWLGASWPSQGQTKATEIKVQGTISGPTGKLSDVSVFMRGTTQCVSSDSVGNYELIIKGPLALAEDIAIVFEKPGHSVVELHVTGGKDSIVSYNPHLRTPITRSDIERMPPRTGSYFYASSTGVSRESIWKRFYKRLLFWRN